MTIHEIKNSSLYDLDPWTFDQTSNGWRGLPTETAQINAIKKYIKKYVTNGKFNPTTPKHTTDKPIGPDVLYWHLGQILAIEGQTLEAIKYMKQSMSDDAQWNIYTKATIAFLKKDKKTFEELLKNNPNNMNISTLRRLRSNWGRPYRDAY